MKNITLSADKNLIENAHKKARQENSTLNQKFREWLESYVNKTSSEEEFEEIMKQLRYVKPGKTFTREQRIKR